MEIRTNNVSRILIDAYQLTAKERQEFDYLNWKDIDDGNDSATFFRFKGQLYDMGEFMKAPDSMKPWDGVSSDSAFSGVLVKYTADFDRVIVAQYFS